MHLHSPPLHASIPLLMAPGYVRFLDYDCSFLAASLVEIELGHSVVLNVLDGFSEWN